MGSFVGRRPSPAMLVALIALFVALGGVSYGLAVGSISSREIKNNSVRSVDIRNGEVRSQDVRDASLLAKDFKAGQLPAGPKGATGDRGPSDVFALRQDAGGDLPSAPGPLIGQLNLPAGAYAILARLVISGSSNTSYLADCELRVGDNTDKASVSALAPAAAAGSVPVTLSLVHSSMSAATAVVACTDSASQPASWTNLKITAIRVEKAFSIAASP